MRDMSIKITSIIIAVMSGTIAYYYSKDIAGLLTHETLLAHTALVEQFVTTYHFRSVALYILAHIMHSACMLPATSAFIILGGFCFGTIRGSIYALVSGCIGGTIAFFAAQRFTRLKAIEKQQAYLHTIQHALGKNRALLMIVIRMIPYIPFCAANIIAGVALLPLTTFIWTLLVGIAPSVWMYSALGAELHAHQTITQAHTPYSMVQPISLLVTTSLVAWYITRRITDTTSRI